MTEKESAFREALVRLKDFLVDIERQGYTIKWTYDEGKHVLYIACDRYFRIIGNSNL
jgi:hypothetical protein